MDKTLPSPPRRVLRWQWTVLSALVVMQFVAITWLWRHGAFEALEQLVRRPRPQVTSVQEWKQALARDPRPGLRVPPVNLRDSDGLRLDLPARDRASGMLFVHSCTDCVAPYIAIWNRLHRAYPEADFYVVPVTPEATSIQAFRYSHRLGVRFITDGNASLLKVCNPFFLPRAYLIGPKGNLVYVQPPSASTASALEQVRATLVRDRRSYRQSRDAQRGQRMGGHDGRSP
jgi:hypothetical protein